MSVTYEQAEKVKEFLLQSLNIDHVGIGLSLVKMHDKKAPQSEQEDWCVSIRFCKTALDGVTIPTEKDGVRIFIRENCGMPQARWKNY